MKEIRLKSKAKINLCLDVVGKRDDGYHDLRMIMQSVELHDKLLIRKVKNPGIHLKTNLPYLPVDDRNLVVRVIDHMMKAYELGSDLGLFVDLYKMIPVGAGLAGGSGNAASAIMGMNELFDLNLDMETMMAIGRIYGADIPYCLLGNTALAEGIGEKLTILKPFKEAHLIIAKPSVSAATATVFKQLKWQEIEEHPDVDGMIKAIEEGDQLSAIHKMGNVLEPVTMNMYKDVRVLKEKLIALGSIGALMSGSGSAVFGFFDSEKEVKRAARKLRASSVAKHIFETTIMN